MLVTLNSVHSAKNVIEQKQAFLSKPLLILSCATHRHQASSKRQCNLRPTEVTQLL